ncbi:hypothetical protein L4D06_08035 [Enterovibrio makurazakiensis]|uniref:hypothetical protein n=1 Tax=Enterovibrio makurazakiensis TaxID=2910232 RepID=UPI003D1C1DE4
MHIRWLVAITAISVLLIGVAVTDFDSYDRPPSSPYSQNSSSDSEYIGVDRPLVAAAKIDISEDAKYETESERLEAEIIKSANSLAVEITQAKEKLDIETAQALSNAESPDVVLSRAYKIMEELEKQGIDFQQDPSSLSSSATNAPITKEVVVIAQKIKEIETDLMDIEHRFNNLGENKEYSDEN